MFEISEIRDANELLKHYEEEFLKLYKIKPPGSLNDDILTAKWAVHEYGLERSKTFVTEYLVFKDKWIREQGYPFKYLKKTIQAMAVSNTDNGRSMPINSRGPKLAVSMSCDKCFKYFVRQCYSDELEQPAMCRNCL